MCVSDSTSGSGKSNNSGDLAATWVATRATQVAAESRRCRRRQSKTGRKPRLTLFLPYSIRKYKWGVLVVRMHAFAPVYQGARVLLLRTTPPLTLKAHI